MNDEELVAVWETLQPTVGQRRRIDARVHAWLEAHDTPLVVEWLGLFRATPFSALGLVSASAFAIAVAAAPPLLWIARVLN